MSAYQYFEGLRKQKVQKVRQEDRQEEQKSKSGLKTPFGSWEFSKTRFRTQESYLVPRPMSASARPIHVGREEIGSVAVFTPEEDGAPWSYLGVENADLAVDSLRLAKGELRDWKTGQTHHIQCGMTTLEKLFAVGPTHHLIGHLSGREPIGAFEFHPLADKRVIARDASLWEANCKTQKWLITKPTHKGIVVRKELAQRMRAKKSQLLFARNMSWLSQAL